MVLHSATIWILNQVDFCSDSMQQLLCTCYILRYHLLLSLLSHYNKLHKVEIWLALELCKIWCNSYKNEALVRNENKDKAEWRIVYHKCNYKHGTDQLILYLGSSNPILPQLCSTLLNPFSYDLERVSADAISPLGRSGL